MSRMILAAGLMLLLTNLAPAQSYCIQVREAVATYGLKAARKHALANYGREAVREADKCLTGKRATSPRKRTRKARRG